MVGMIGKKIDAKRVFDESGRSVALTVIQSGPCVVTQIKDEASDGYNAVQLGFEDKKGKHTTKPLLGHFGKANASPKRKLVEFRGFEEDFSGELKLGQTVHLHDVFSEGDCIDVVGKAKGKGFQGVVKSHGFSGVGGRTHGQHNRERARGSVGASSFPSRVFKGTRMARRHGGHRVKVKHLKILKIIADAHLMLIRGVVPGAKNGYVILQR